MAIAEEPKILIRYDEHDALDAFQAALAVDLKIVAVPDDKAAITALAEYQTLPDALLILTSQPSAQVSSPLLAHAREFYPGLLKILVSNAVPLETLMALLEKRLVDRCFEQPLDPDLIRSHVLTSALTGKKNSTIAPENPASSATHASTVLIVDDESAATKYLARQLERMQNDFRVLCANSAETALETMKAESEGVAVIMTDQRMPGMQGKELLDELKLSHPATVRILTSAYGEVDVALDAVNEGGIFRYQKKPWRAEELLPLFREAIARHFSLISAHRKTLSHLEQQFMTLREQRRAQLLTVLSGPLNTVSDRQALIRFLQALDTIPSLAANASHLRASQETGLERDLVQRFEEQMHRQLARLQAVGPGPTTLDKSIVQAGLQRADQDEGEDNDTVTLLSVLCRSLTTLLAASGQRWQDLHMDQAVNNQLILTSKYPLKLYAHLLAPLTRLSRPLLNQQVALLLLFVTTHRLGGNLAIRGGTQSCELELALPLAAAPEA